MSRSVIPLQVNYKLWLALKAMGCTTNTDEVLTDKLSPMKPTPSNMRCESDKKEESIGSMAIHITAGVGLLNCNKPETPRYLTNSAKRITYIAPTANMGEV